MSSPALFENPLGGSTPSAEKGVGWGGGGGGGAYYGLDCGYVTIKEKVIVICKFHFYFENVEESLKILKS